MTTARFYVPTASVGDALIGAFDTAEVLSYSASEIRLGVPGGPTLMILYGQFNFTSGGELTGGTLTGLTTYLADGIAKEMVLSGMNVDLLTLVDVAMSGSENDLINLFFGGADRFTGSSGADELPTYGGNDTIDGGAGNDTMEGGNGADLYYVRDVGDRVVETNSSATSGGVDTVQSYLASYTLPSNVENGRIMTSTAAKLAGNGLANVLTGGSGADTLVGGAGNDKLNGGEGADTADYSGATAAVKLNLSLTGAQATGGAGTDTLSSIERLVGSGFADQLIGNSGANRLDGGAGNDTLDGGAGNDALIGGNGNDVYQLRDAGDSASETNAASSGGVDTVLSYLASHTLGTNIENGRIMSSGTASLSGNGLNNLLVAGAGNNVLNGGSGIDTVSYAGAGAAVKLGLSAGGGQVTGGSGTDTLAGIENLIGSAYNDTLVGNGGANALSGGNGNDLLNGGSGIDRLTGGSGADLFRFNSTPNASSNVDTVTDFRGVDDSIQLENAIFTKLAKTGALPASNFAANTSGRAVDGNDFVVYETDTGKLFYDADGSGAGAAVQIALLSGAPVLSNLDFFVT